jgi:hypothetical protein
MEFFKHLIFIHSIEIKSIILKKKETYAQMLSKHRFSTKKI